MDEFGHFEKIKIALLVILVIVFSITAGLSLSRLTNKQALKTTSQASETTQQGSCAQLCAQATGGKGRCIKGDVGVGGPGGRYECTRVGGMPMRCGVFDEGGVQMCKIIEEDDETCCVLGWNWEGTDSCSDAKSETQCRDLNHWYQCGWDACNQKCFGDIQSREQMRIITCPQYDECAQFEDVVSCDAHQPQCAYFICADEGKGKCLPKDANGRYNCPHVSAQYCANLPLEMCNGRNGCTTRTECNGRTMCTPYDWPRWYSCEKYGPTKTP